MDVLLFFHYTNMEYSLPDYVVASPTINTFKARLDKFWENKLDVPYN